MIAHIGIDPGANGSAAVLTEDRKIHIIRFNKATEKEVWEFFRDISYDYECFCTLEQVGAMPGQGVSSMFSFGDSVGFIRGILTASGVPFEQKVPRVWQKALGIAPRLIERDATKKIIKEESKTDFKRRLKEKAEQLFPTVKVTLDVADSLLIAEFNKRTRG